ncbi:DUF423 domain-containing protein [Xanthomonadaceae bacterium JHOS43]|nr:DUF423 domain-containing protein [Xanthomonadaceae bacterium JHOS43]MCX7562468.1 DUF423 domain-containing protein [Xanthomonadaceae bacterium XH05]
MTGTRVPAIHRFAAALGAVFCAVAVGLGAYAAHAAPDVAKSRLDTAALHLFFHGFALAVFALRQRGRWASASLVLWLAGCISFSGSLVAGALWGASTAMAPIGGIAFMLGWLSCAMAMLQPNTADDVAVR